ncbi:response regulator [Puniceicoccaceae bacterium K14]|nr:response regulator [Puniceicoccaceae bacterium K14]
MSERYRILYVDDEKHSLTAFRMTFEDEFEVYTADNCNKAYEILKSQPIHLIVADQRMPNETGVEFLKRTRAEFPNAVRTILTGYSDLEAIVDAINQSHIYYYFKKPWKEEELKLVFRNAIEAVELTKRNTKLTQDLQNTLSQLKEKTHLLEEQAIQREELVIELENSNKIKSDFLSVISHELRTPLNPIIGLTSIMLNQDPEEENLENLSIIQRCSEDLLGLIDGILDFLHFDRKTPRKLASIELDILLGDMVALALSSKADTDAVEIRKLSYLNGKAAQALPPVFSDNEAIRQILRNLICNACKFTRKGHIEISANLTTSPLAELKFSIKDTGPGIASESHEKIFEAFTQVDQSLTRSHEGIGLGLSICKKLADRLEAKLTVESELGTGSTFCLRVPVRLEAPSAPFSQSANLKVSLGLKALTVQEKTQQGRVVESMLQRIDCEVVSCDNPTEALDLVKKSPVDIIFLDLTMPSIDGETFYNEVQNLDFDIRPRLIAIYSEETTDPSSIFINGIETYLQKPVRLKELVAHLQKVR